MLEGCFRSAYFNSLSLGLACLGELGDLGANRLAVLEEEMDFPILRFLHLLDAKYGSRNVQFAEGQLRDPGESQESN